MSKQLDEAYAKVLKLIEMRDKLKCLLEQAEWDVKDAACQLRVLKNAERKTLEAGL